MVEIDIYLGASSVRTCLGDKSQTLSAMKNGECGLKYFEDWKMHVGASDVDILDGFTRFESLVVEQINNVVKESGVDLSAEDIQLIISTTKGNIDYLAQDCENIPQRTFIGNSAKIIAEHFALANEPIVISNACISGVSAFVVAGWVLRKTKCNHVIVVGADALCEFITSGFASFKSISPAPCKPYDATRDGLTLGEAAGAVLLTKDASLADDAKIRLVGGAISNDANHISGPSRTGDGLYYAIRNAMDESHRGIEEVGFVNTHGTATRYNDEMESKAIAWAQLDNKPLNSVKGYIGHTLGASGVVETIICAEELKEGLVFGTKGFTESDTPHKLTITTENQIFKGECCVKTASGFGGCNAAIVLTKDDSNIIFDLAPIRNTKVVAEYTLPQSDMDFADFIRAEFKSFGDSNMKFYKMSDMSKALYVAVEHLLKIEDFAEVEPTRRAIVLANKSASLDADIIHQRILNKRLPEGASPAAFVYTLANVAAGEICIRHKIQGDNTFFIDEDSGLTEKYATSLIEDYKADAVIYGYCEYLQGKWNVNIKLLKNK